MANKSKRILSQEKAAAGNQEPRPARHTVTVEPCPDGTFTFHGGKGGFNIIEQKNAALAEYGKCICNYGIVLELIPGNKLEAINQQIGNARLVHNDYLSERINYYKETGEALSVAKYKKDYLPSLKERCDFLKKSDKFTLENACRNVDNAYNRFFKGLGGFPKYASYNKPNGNSFTTNFTNNNIELKMVDGLPYVKLPKIGCIRFILPKGKTFADLQPHGVSIKAATVSRSNRTYRVSLRMESVIDKPDFPIIVRESDILTVDLGIKYFGVFGDKKESVPVANPRWIKLHARRLRRFQKSLSRKQYDKTTHTGSRNWEKARFRVAKEQRKTADQRKDFHHKLSRIVVNNCTAFICEDLAVKNMMMRRAYARLHQTWTGFLTTRTRPITLRPTGSQELTAVFRPSMKNRHLSKAIASVGWSQFLIFVKYKMERAGKYFRKVSRWYPSSQTCGCCGYKNTKVKKLTVREWTCPKCRTWHDRDINAQKNIFSEGVKLLQAEGIQIQNHCTPA